MQRSEEIYYSQNATDYFRMDKTYDTREQEEQMTYIKQHIFKETKTRQKNLVEARIDLKMADDIVPQTLIIVFENVQNIRRNHKRHHAYHGKLESEINNKKSNLWWGKIEKCFLLGNSFSPWLFVIAMMSLIGIILR